LQVVVVVVIVMGCGLKVVSYLARALPSPVRGASAGEGKGVRWIELSVRDLRGIRSVIANEGGREK